MIPRFLRHLLKTIASVEDGFTFTLTIRDDNTFDAFTTGLSTDFAITNNAIGSDDPEFADFINDGIGLNASVQGSGNDNIPAAGFIINSVTLSAVPEPSTSLSLIHI